MPALEDAAVVVARPSSTRRLLPVAIGMTAGAAITVLFLRRQLLALAVRAQPYVRRRVRVSNPALIVNRWSGDGKADRFGLVDAARDAGIRVIMLERGDDIAQLARDAIDTPVPTRSARPAATVRSDWSPASPSNGMFPSSAFRSGTRNHFALDLGLDRDNPLTALDAIRNGEEVLIDYGLAGDRPFLNNVSFGVYAEAVHRDEYRENKERTIAEVMREMRRRRGQRHGDPVHHTAGRARRADGDDHGVEQPVRVLRSTRLWATPPPRHRHAGDQRRPRRGTSVEGTTGARIRHWEADHLRLESDQPILAGLDGEALTFDSPLGARDPATRGLRVLVPAGTKPGYVPPREAIAAELVGLARLAGVPGTRRRRRPIPME